MTDDEKARCSSCAVLRRRISELEAEIASLKSSNTISNGELHCKNNNGKAPSEGIQFEKDSRTKEECVKSDCTQDIEKLCFPLNKCDLTNDDIARYSRQILLPEINASGQNKLAKSSVLIVGTGGLGCPAGLYLSASGVGCIGLVDYDVVDISNLQRQVLHTEDRENMAKVDSAVFQLRQLNSKVNYHRYNFPLNSSNCMDIIQKFDIILDCSDNVATRYLLNDACVLADKALVSGSALRWEGQLTVYNCNKGPCYRCLYPTPPPPEMVSNCSDVGVMGSVTGVIGALQGLEAIKIITGNNSSYAGKLLLFDGWSGSFRNIKLRGRVKDCIVCGDTPSITELQDYEEFCGSKADDKEKNVEVLRKESRISVSQYCKFASEKHLLVDVRPEIEYEICSLVGSVNIPLKDILYKKKLDIILDSLRNNKKVFVLCKRGNESQQAVMEILKYAKEEGMMNGVDNVKDLRGGLVSWHYEIDEDVPLY